MAGVGCGLTAAGAVEGGADLLAVYSTAVFRRLGLPSALSFLPYHDCNKLAFEAAREVMPQAGETPVLLGLGAHDPRSPIRCLLDGAERLGVSGVMNEPFVGMYGPAIRGELERAGLGFAREVELIAAAAKRGLVAFGWAFSPAEAQAMAEAGAHIVGAMLGATQSDQGNADSALAEAVEQADATGLAALAAAPDILVLAHGGILSAPSTVSAFLARSRCHGYATGSSAERRPVIEAVSDVIRRFKSSKSMPKPGR